MRHDELRRSEIQRSVRIPVQMNDIRFAGTLQILQPLAGTRDV
jgi:hypothetical protein